MRRYSGNSGDKKSRESIEKVDRQCSHRNYYAFPNGSTRLYQTETEFNICIIGIFLQPELENEKNPVGQKPPELWQVSGLRCTALTRLCKHQCFSLPSL